MRAQSLGLIAALLLGACATATQTAATQESLPPIPAGVALAPGADMPTAYVGQEWLVDHYGERIAVFMDYTPVNGGVVFMGDSITEGGNWTALFPGVESRNYGIGGDRAEGLLARYRQVVASRPGRVLILIGTNDLSSGYTPERIAGEVDQLLGRFGAELPETQLVVQSVLPRQAEFNDRILELNTRLQAVAEARDAGFIDIHAPFVVRGDRLDPTVTEDDLHLTPAGYERWARLIEPCVSQGACG